MLREFQGSMRRRDRGVNRSDRSYQIDLERVEISCVGVCLASRLPQRRFGVLYKATRGYAGTAAPTKTLVERFRFWNGTRISFCCRRARL